MMITKEFIEQYQTGMKIDAVTVGVRLNTPAIAVAMSRNPAIAAIADKLDQYVHHHGWCEVEGGGDYCDCGLWALWNEFAYGEDEAHK